jgi:hypothetical protein
MIVNPPRVEWLVSEHLSTLRAGRMHGRASLFLLFKQKLNPSYWCIWCIQNHKKWITTEKVSAPESKGIKNPKTQTVERYKASSRTSQKFLVCCSVAIRVQSPNMISRIEGGNL